MSAEASTVAVASFVVPGIHGYSVTCSCGYLVTGLPTQQLAQTDMDNHWQRCHAKRDDAA